MKISYRINAILFIIITFCTVSCSIPQHNTPHSVQSSQDFALYAGTYIAENKKDYLVLNADGTFFNKERNRMYSGVYRVIDNVITLTLPAGQSSSGRIEGTTLIDKEETHWIKQ